MQISVRWAVFTLAVFIAGAGCAPSVSTGFGDFITVEGRVSARGNAPFTELVLVSDTGNWYVLDLTEDQRRGLMTPARLLLSGRVHRGEWHGRPFARLRVQSMRRIE